MLIQTCLISYVFVFLIKNPDVLFQSMSEEKYRPLASRLMVGRPRWKLLFDEIGKTNKQYVDLDYDWELLREWIKLHLLNCTVIYIRLHL